MIKAVVFDLGGVLIDWNPEYVYLDVFEGDREKMKWFYDEICTQEWNEEQDAGKSLSEATEERVKLFPQYEEWIRMYYGRWEEMLGDEIRPTVDVLEHLRQKGDYRLLALTNWSAETFPKAIAKFEFLKWFEGIVVSGEEKTRKPFKEIFDILLTRYELKAEECIFIDDNARNVEAASSYGFHSIRFENAENLRSALTEFGVEP